MRTNCHGKALKRQRLTYALAMALAVTIASPQQALAAGTRAGSTISNTAQASFDNGAGTQTVNSNPVNLLVDELLDVTVASSDPADVPTTPGATNGVLTFEVTNTGNGKEKFGLTTIANGGGDDYDPTVTQIYLDNGDGVFDSNTDTLYVPGNNDPDLDPDAKIKVFVIASTPGSVSDGNRGTVQLVASAKTGTGAPGTSFSGAGEGGGDAVVGSTGADGNDNGAFVVTSATVTLVKSAVVADPFGGADPLPGSTITYTIVATVAGNGSISGLTITDPVPTNTTYVAGTIKLNGATLTDSSSDADAGNFDGSKVTVALGSVSGGQTRTITFQTKIN